MVEWTAPGGHAAAEATGTGRTTRSAAIRHGLWRRRLAITTGLFLGVLAGDRLLAGDATHEARATLEVPSSFAGEAPRGAHNLLGAVAEGVPSRPHRVEAHWRAGGDRLEIRARAPTRDGAVRRARAEAEGVIARWRADREARAAWLAGRVALRAEAVQAAEARLAALDSEAGPETATARALREDQRTQLEARVAALTRRIESSAAAEDSARAARAALLFMRAARSLDTPALEHRAAAILATGTGGDSLPTRAIARFDQAFEALLDRHARARARLSAERRDLREMIAMREAGAAAAEAAARERAARRAALNEARAAHRALAGALTELTSAGEARILSVSETTAPVEAGAPAGQLLLAGLGGGALGGLATLLRLPRRRERVARPAPARSADDPAQLEVPAAVEPLGHPAPESGLARFGHVGAVPVQPGALRRALSRIGDDDPFEEDLATLRDEMMHAGGGGETKVVAVTAPAGPTDAAAAMACAVTLARLSLLGGRRVAVVECDCTGSRLRPAFAIPGDLGLLSVLEGRAAYHEALHIDGETGLHLIPGESAPPAAAPVPARLAEFMQLLRRTYDQVFLALPALGAGMPVEPLLGPEDSLICLVQEGTPGPQAAQISALRRAPGVAGIAVYRPAPPPAMLAAPAPRPEASASPRPAARDGRPAPGRPAKADVLHMFESIRGARG